MVRVHACRVVTVLHMCDPVSAVKHMDVLRRVSRTWHGVRLRCEGARVCCGGRLVWLSVWSVSTCICCECAARVLCACAECYKCVVQVVRVCFCGCVVGVVLVA